jgi:hypothetical protein
VSVTGFNRRRRELAADAEPKGDVEAHDKPKTLAQMKKPELQALAESLGLDQVGTNEELRERIKAAQDAKGDGE